LIKKYRISWAIDPFGASSAINRLFNQMGFKATVHDRISFLDRDKLIANNSMEFNWKTSPGIATKSKMFTHILTENYCVGR